MLEHFDEYARGKGILQKRAIVIHVPTALAASEALHHAVYAAGKAVDAHRSD